jgi:hypothetical protein
VRLVTVAEEEHYEQLKLRLSKNELKLEDVHYLVNHLRKNRTRYKEVLDKKGILKEAISNLFGPMKWFCLAVMWLPECCCGKETRGSEKYKKRKRYENGAKRFLEEMDIVG